MQHKNIIINVGRQLGAGGHAIAKLLAEEFNCKLYDKEILNLAAKESGFSERFFEQNDEQKGFLKSLFHLHAPHVGDNNFYNSRFSQEQRGEHLHHGQYRRQTEGGHGKGRV